MWKSWNPCILLVRMQNGTTAMGNSMKVPQKNKNRTTISLSSPTSGCLSIRMEMSILKRYQHTHVPQ